MMDPCRASVVSALLRVFIAGLCSTVASAKAMGISSRLVLAADFSTQSKTNLSGTASATASEQMPSKIPGDSTNNL